MSLYCPDLSLGENPELALVSMGDYDSEFS